ncbi:hypothetical protein B0H19DRAFT_1331338 [Mycena capillaripes]|nr:hypothetical protein B0H19DRAFT_1331338 [Mycena capillaripes]
MPTIPETPISIAVTSDLPNNLSIKLLVSITIVAVMAVLIHYTSPQRHMGVLVDAMAKLKKTSSDAFEAGRFSASEIETLRSLKQKFSTIQAETLDDSRSYLKTICGFLKGRTFTVLLCIWEVQDLEMHIKIILALWQFTDRRVDSVGDDVGATRLPSLLQDSPSSKTRPSALALEKRPATTSSSPATTATPSIAKQLGPIEQLHVIFNWGIPPGRSCLIAVNEMERKSVDADPIDQQKQNFRKCSWILRDTKSGGHTYNPKGAAASSFLTGYGDEGSEEGESFDDQHVIVSRSLPLSSSGSQGLRKYPDEERN